MAKTLCDWSKRDLEKHPDKLLELVRDPRYYCRKCARVAHTSKVLCKPRSFSKATLSSPAEGVITTDSKAERTRRR